MRARILIAIITCCIAACSTAPRAGNNHQVYLVRHAEKQSDGSHDPALSGAGEQRSRQLAAWLKDKNIREIWSTDYQRSRDTADPALSMLGLELRVYDPGKLAGLARKLKNTRHNALIVGHSNTTPELARLLCDCAIDVMDESEYDRLIMISFVDGKTLQLTLRQDPLTQ